MNGYRVYLSFETQLLLLAIALLDASYDSVVRMNDSKSTPAYLVLSLKSMMQLCGAVTNMRPIKRGQHFRREYHLPAPFGADVVLPDVEGIGM